MLFAGWGNRGRCRNGAVEKGITAGQEPTANVVCKQVARGGAEGDLGGG